ncbi:MAG: hypothetical protein IH598_12985 [Bacteroidales bacterium]|nr:hypothetical protein [Bacteroidales bacterium]
MKKKIVLTALLFAFTLPFFAQTKMFDVTSADGATSQKAVGNFTIIDSDGQSWTLYDELDKGRTILIDIFSAT